MENDYAERVTSPTKSPATAGHWRTERDMTIKDALARIDDCVERMLPDDPVLRERALYVLAPGFRPLFTLVCEKTP